MITFSLRKQLRKPAAHLGKRLLAACCAASFFLPALATIAEAQSANLPLVRDAETEDLIRDYALPIFKAAGLPTSQVQIILVNDKSFNAFVPDGKRMFINIGVLLQAKTPGEVIGVIAHETGHIAGKHLIRMHEALAHAQIMSIVGLLLGVGTAAAGAGSGSTSVGSGGAAVALGAGSLGARSFLAYQRGQEAAADQAALKFLEATHQSAKGMLTTFKRMEDEQLFSARYADPYAQSHPMAHERYISLERAARKSKYFDTPAPAELQRRHDMVRAKLLAFTSDPRTVYRSYPKSDKSMPARYAHAISAMRTDRRQALPQIDALIKSDPKNPYYYELKGQDLLESGHPAEAVPAFRRTVALRPREGQFLVWLGYALVSSEQQGELAEAVKVLRQGLQYDPNSAIGYAQLAIAQARLGDRPQADLATAQGLMIRGDFGAARRYAARAQKAFKRGTPAWIQADDIVSYKAPNLTR